MLDFITSTRGYLVDNIAESRGVTSRMVQYIFLFGLFYLIGIFILHKVHYSFVKLSHKKKANFLIACDAVLYEYQNTATPQDLTRIQTLIKDGSYEKNYKLFLQKAAALGTDTGPKLVSELKREYGKYQSVSGIKIGLGAFLVLITLGIYLLFWEN